MNRALAWSCFAVSGFSGLVYQVCWIRRAGLLFGSTVYALSTVVAVFFLGLALGGILFGRRASRVERPLRLYALVEIGLAVLALLSLPGLELAATVHGALYRWTSSTAVLAVGRVLLVAIVLLPPAILIGGTLPLMVSHFARQKDVLRPVGLLYGINTLGAAAGCLAAGFVLLPELGLVKTVALGAALNGLVGLVLFRSPAPDGSRASEARVPSRRAPAIDDAASGNEGTVLILSALAGFAALAIEVLWTRYLALLVPNTVQAFSLTLAVVLVGIVLGSLLAAALLGRARSGRVLGLLQLGLAVSIAGIMSVPPRFWFEIEGRTLVSAGLLLVPSILSGAIFPLAVRLSVSRPGDGGRAAGFVAGANTLGGIAGSLLAGFLLLPALGLQRSLFGVAAVSLAAGLWGWWRLERGDRRPRLVAGMAALLLCVLLPVLSRVRLPQDALARTGELIDFREGLESNLAVVRRDGITRLEMNRLWQGQDRRTHQVMAAHVPLTLHPAPRKVLIVGAGAGQTAERALLHDIEQLTVVDIEPVVFDLIRLHFGGTAWMDDPRVRIVRADGRNHLLHTNERYDLVSLEVGQLFRPGAADFYTLDFYKAVREKLGPGGMVSQFVPLPFLEESSFRSIVRTFGDVFPECLLWYNTSELLLIGTTGSSFRIEPDRLARLANDGKLRKDLDFGHWGGTRYPLHRPDVFLAGFLAGPAELRALGDDASRLVDDRPVLAYATSGVPDSAMLEVPLAGLIERQPGNVASILAEPPDDSLRNAIDTVRRRNLGDIRAAAWLRIFQAPGGNRPGLASALLIRRAIEANPENTLAGRLLGDLYVMENRFEQAQGVYEEVVSRDPYDALAHRGLAYVLHRGGNLGDAIAHYREALRLSPDDPESHNNLGAALAQVDPAGARIEFARAIELRPEYVEARNNLARLPETLPEPRTEPRWGTEECASCRMPVGSRSFAARLISGGRAFFFDDPGCVAVYLNTDRPPAPEIAFRHVEELRWVPLEEVRFIRNEKSPMAFGFAAVGPGEGEITFDQIREEMVRRFFRKP